MSSLSQQTQLAINGLERDAAYSAAGALAEVIEPAADAVSIFEDGSSWRIDAYYPDRTDGEAALAQLASYYPDTAARALLDAVPEENWVALSQSALPPVHAGRFTICGSHDLDRVPVGPNTIVVEAGEAFGTAHHATTYGCLLAVDRLTRQTGFRRVLDLGTGSGILALALQRALPQAQITASDIDARSIEVASENARRNGLGHRSGGPNFVVADGVGDGRLKRAGPFELIVANILAGPLNAMAGSITGALANRGTLVLSGILVPQAADICARYGSLGLTLIRHDRYNGWSTIVMRRNQGTRAMKKAPLAEPFNLYVPDDD